MEKHLIMQIPPILLNTFVENLSETLIARFNAEAMHDVISALEIENTKYHKNGFESTSINRQQRLELNKIVEDFIESCLTETWITLNETYKITK